MTVPINKTMAFQMLKDKHNRHERTDKTTAQIKETRKRLGLDQQTTADLAGVSVRFLRELEHGKPTVQLQQLVAVADVLGLDLILRPRSLAESGHGDSD